MKVKELIAQLEKYDGELELYQYEWPDEPLHLKAYEWRGSHVMVRECGNLGSCGTLPVIERFTDGSPHKANAIMVD